MIQQKIIVLLRQYTTVVTLFIVLASFFGLLFVFKTPLLWGEDEITQFSRSYQVSRGHILPIKVGANNYGGYVPDSAYKLFSFVGNGLSYGSKNSALSNGVGWFATSTSYDNLKTSPLNSKDVIAEFPNTAPYSPIAYLPSSAGLLVSSLLKLDLSNSIYLARLFSLIFFVIAIAYSLKSLKPFRAKWIVFTVALLPMVIFQASTITADTMTLTIIIVISSLYLKTILKSKLNKTETVVFISGILALPLVKPTYILFALLILLVPSKRLSLGGRYATFLKYVTVAISFGLLGVWSYLTRSLENAPSLALPTYWAPAINPKEQIQYSLHHPIAVSKVFIRTAILNDNYYLNGMVGGFGYNNILVPAVAVLSSLGAMVLSILNSEKLKLNWQRSTSLIIVSAGSIFALFYTFYLTITPVGTTEGSVGMIVQGLMGRYFVPYIILVLTILAILFKPRFTKDKTTYDTVKKTIIILVVFSLLVSFLKYYYVTWG